MITDEFVNWLESEKIKSSKFEKMIWEMKWGIYQKYFWINNSWWLSIYPYTDKFGGRIDKFWDECLFNSNFITNSPRDAQNRLIKQAFVMEDEIKKNRLKFNES